MLKKVSLEELGAVSGGYTMEQLASVNHRVGLGEGLHYAQYAYAHARANGMSARQFNCIGWRDYARGVAAGGGGVRTQRRTYSAPSATGGGELREYRGLPHQ